MGVLGSVAVQVVMAMMIGPPERAALHGGAGEHGEEELAEARRAVGLVREIAVVDARDREHADEVQGHRSPDGKGAGTGPDHAEAAGMQEDEGHDAHPVHAVRLGAHLFGPIRAIIGINPLREGGGGATKR